MYRSLAGIAPASAGYGTVTIAPKVSKTLDPAAVNASVATVRGVVTSSWTRHKRGSGCFNGLATLVTFRIGVPVGMLGDVHVPLLGEPASKVVVTVRDNHTTNGVGSSLPRVVWGEGADSLADTELSWLRSPPKAARTEGAEVVMLEVAASELEIEAKVSC
jgi:hypothetical protein